VVMSSFLISWMLLVCIMSVVEGVLGVQMLLRCKVTMWLWSILMVSCCLICSSLSLLC